MAVTLNISSLAEGVENQAQLDELANFGCDEAQGVLLGAPQPAEALPSLLAEWSATRWTAAVTPFRGTTVRIPLRSMNVRTDAV